MILEEHYFHISNGGITFKLIKKNGVTKLKFITHSHGVDSSSFTVPLLNNEMVSTLAFSLMDQDIKDAKENVKHFPVIVDSLKVVEQLEREVLENGTEITYLVGYMYVDKKTGNVAYTDRVDKKEIGRSGALPK